MQTIGKAMKTFRRESNVKAAIKKLVDEHGWFNWTGTTAGFGSSGASDRLCFRDSVFMAVEAKRNTEVTVNQRNFLVNISNLGGFAFVVDHLRLEHFEAFLDAFDRAQNAVKEGRKPAPEDGSIMLNCTAEMHKELFAKPKEKKK